MRISGCLWIEQSRIQASGYVMLLLRSIAFLTALIISMSVSAIEVKSSLENYQKDSNGRLVYKVLISNTDNVTRTNVRLDLSIPSGWRFSRAEASIQASGCNTCSSGSSTYWIFDSLAAGKSVELVIPFYSSNLADQTGNSLSFIASVTHSGTANAIIDEISTLAVAAQTIHMSVSASKKVVKANDVVDYEITFGNVGTSGFVGQYISADIPSGATFVSASGNGVLSNGKVVWDSSSVLNIGESERRYFSVQLPAGSAGSIYTTEVSWAQTSSSAVQQTTSENVVIGDDSGVELSVAVSGGLQTDATSTDYRYVISNNGTTTQSAMTLSVLMGTGSYLASYESMPTFYGNKYNSNWFYFTVDALAPGESEVIYVPVRPYNETDGKPFISQAILTIDELDSWQAIKPTVRYDTTDSLALTISSSKQSVAADEEFRYDVSLGNLRTTAFQNIDIIAELPENVTVVSAEGDATIVGNTVTWTYSTLNSGVNNKRSINVVSDEGLENGTQLKANITAQLGNEILSDGSEIVFINDDQSLGLDIALSTDVNSDNQATWVRYIISNNSELAKTDVTLYLKLAKNSIVTSYDDLPSNYGNRYYGNWFSYSLGQINAGETKAVTLPIQRSNAIDGQIWETTAFLSDATSFFVQGTKPTIINKIEDTLIATLVASKEVVGAGDVFEYEVSVGNPSSTATQNVTVELDVPQNFTVSDISDGGVYEGNTISWSLNTVNSGTSTKRSVKMHVPIGLVDGTTRKAHLTTKVGGEAVAHSTVINSINNNRDLELYVSVTGDVSTPNQQSFYRYNVTNNGLLSRTDVKLFISMAGWSYLGSYESLPSFYGNKYMADWFSYDLGQIDPGQSKTVIIPFLTTGQVTDGMILDSQAVLTDGSSSYIQAMRPTVTYDSSASLLTSISADKQTVSVGEKVEYEATFANLASSATQNVELIVDIPDELSVTDISDNGYFSSGKVYWDIGTVNSLNNGKRFFTAITDDELSEGDVVLVKATLNTGGASISRASEAVVLQNNIGLQLAVATSGTSWEEGNEDDAHYRYIISNNGETSKTNVQVVLSPGYGSRVRPNNGAPAISSSYYYVRDWLTYSFDELQPGESRTIYLPIYASNAVEGSPWISHVMVSDQSASYTLSANPTILRGSEYDGLKPLVNIESDGAIKEPGDNVTFSVAIGNPSEDVVENGMVITQIPENMAFVSASGLYEVIDDKVYWPLGDIPIGTWRKESLTLAISASATNGELLHVESKLLNSSNLGAISIASDVVIVQESAGVALSINNSYTVPMVEDSKYILNLDVVNGSEVQVADVSLSVKAARKTYMPASEHPTGSCSNGSYCYEYDWMNFSLGNMDDGESISFNANTYLRSSSQAPESGQLLSSIVRVTHSSTPSSDIVMTSTLGAGGNFDVDSEHDSDGDGIPDYWELQYSGFANWLDATDADDDLDGDGYTNLEEYLNGLAPDNSDPKDTDTDNLFDSVEIALGLDPNSNDTDGDGIIDRLDNRPTVFNSAQDGLLKVLDNIGDVNSDGIDDVAMVYVESSELASEVAIHAGIVTIDIVNIEDLSLIKRIKWPTAYQDIQLYVLDDIDENGFVNIGVFGMYLTSENDTDVIKPQLYVRDALTGARIATYNWPANWLEAGIVVLEDVTGDGIQDVALEGRFIIEDARPQLMVKNGVNGNSELTYSYPSLFDKPGYVQLSDFNGDGIREIGLFGKLLRNDKYQIKITDGTDSEGKLPAYNYPDYWVENSWHELSDINGDGENDWGMFGIRTDDNRPQLLTKSGTDISGSLGIFAWPEDLNSADFHIIPDVTGDGIDEVAASGYRGSQDRNQFIVKNGANRDVIYANIGWANKWTQVTYHVLGDLNGDGQAEIALYGLRTTGVWELNVRDTLNNDYGVFVIGKDWVSKPLIAVGDDKDGDGHRDVLLYGHALDGTPQTRYMND